MSANVTGSLLRRLVTPLGWRLAADATTLSVMGLGLVAVLLRGHPWLFVALVAAAGLLDGVDGALATRAGGPSRLGAVLDVVADTVAFGLAPALFMLALRPLSGVALGSSIVAGALYVAAAISRLVRSYRAPARRRGSPFVGMPMPGAGLFATCLALALPAVLGAVGLLAVAGLAISRRPYPTAGWFFRHERGLAAGLGVLAGIAALVTPIAGPAVFIAGYAAYPWVSPVLRVRRLFP